MKLRHCLGGGLAVVAWIVCLAACLGIVAPCRGAEAELVPNDKCLECHGQNDLTRTNATGQTLSLFTDEAKLKASAHGTNTCVSCHRDLAQAWQHPDEGPPAGLVNCAGCHAQQSLTYNASVHAAALRDGKSGAATCKDCHGHHDVTHVLAPDSPLEHTKLAATCGQCHTEQAAELAESVHGQAALRGHREAPTCVTCHTRWRATRCSAGRSSTRPRW